MSIAAQLAQIRQAIDKRPVTLVAVTKYASIEQMQEAYAFDVRAFGENMIQAALSKMAHFPHASYPDLDWHFIGHLQTNKARKTVGRFALIHSVDSLRLMEALSRHNSEAGLCQDILLQVNISGEAAKYGFCPGEVRSAVEQGLLLEGVKIRGLMTMAPHCQDQTLLKKVFCDLKSLRNELEATCAITLPDLSMGMSNDFMHALECGATMIRIGSQLFHTTNESA